VVRERFGLAAGGVFADSCDMLYHGAARSENSRAIVAMKIGL
jgi:hypothetical protein